QRGDGSLGRVRLDVEGNEHQRLANVLRPEGAGTITAKKLRIGQDQRAAMPINLRHARSAVLVEAPRACEAKPFHVEPERSLNVAYVQHRAREPVCHGHISSNYDAFSACAAMLTAIRRREKRDAASFSFWLLASCRQRRSSLWIARF